MLIQPQDTSFGTFFGLLNGYRVYELMQVIRESRVMEIVGSDGCGEAQVIEALGWAEGGSRRFVDVLCELGFLQRYDAFLCLSPFSREFLYSASPHSQLRTLEFEPRLRDNWTRLEQALRSGTRVPAAEKTPQEQRGHRELFLDAMDEAAVIRSTELWDVLPVAESGTIMEIGAGSGAYLATFLQRHQDWRGIYCDLPEVIDIARNNSRLSRYRDRLSFIPCDVLAPDFHPDSLPSAEVDLLLLSNLVHCQDAESTGLLLRRGASNLREVGSVLIHDFFKDASWHGALYDFHMLVNTYSGRTYRRAEIASMLKSLGLVHTVTCDLPSHSSVLAASSRADALPELDKNYALRERAASLGFTQSVVIDVDTIPVARWVREKCKTGCPRFGACAACPPNSLSPPEMKELLSEFSTAILVVGEPPLKVFQERIVALERSAFLCGHTKALAFAGGPCSICDACHPTDCRFPEKRRFSLESCGVDVFGLAGKYGIRLQPLTDKRDFVQYVGMVLVE